VAKLQIQKVHWWHERLADWMIANPDKFLTDAAKFFDCNVQTLYLIKNSDSFKSYWAQRSHEASHAIVSDIKDRMCAVTEIALDRIEEKMRKEEMLLGIDTYLDVAKMGLKGLGYGAQKGPAPTVNVNINQVNPELLAKARERMQAAFGIDANEREAKPRETKELETESTKELLLPAPGEGN
jgi:hypothetical protein